jgi:hypothetical protein
MRRQIDFRQEDFLPGPAARSPRPSSSWCLRRPGNACRRAANSYRPTHSHRNRKRNRPLVCAIEPWPPQQQLLGFRLPDALKRDRIERLEICCCLRRPANGARYSNHNGQFSRCYDSPLGKTRTWLLMAQDCNHDSAQNVQVSDEELTYC